MSYKNDDTLVILNKYGKASGIGKTELYETYDRIRDLAVSGPSLGGSGFGKFGSLLLNVARMFGSSAFAPTLGGESINIPGTSFYGPISGGSGVIPGGTAAFGLSPFSQYTGLPTGGAAPINGFSFSSNSFSLPGLFGSLSQQGIGALNSEGELASSFTGIGEEGFSDEALLGGSIVGGASPIDNFASTAGGSAASGLGAAAGTAAGAGFGRNFLMPAAGIASGIGGLLTTLGPFFGPFGLAGAAAGSILSGISGAALSSFQHVSNRLLSNADVELSNKVKNLESTIKMLDAQQDILKKLLKESLDGDKKALDNI